MPNPFMRSGTPNQSGRRKGPDNFGDVKETPVGVGYTTGQETPLPSVGGHSEPNVNAYRGTETHGVAPTGHFHDVDPIDPDDAIVEFEIPPEPPEPIPVRIVQEGKRELIKSTVQHAYAAPGYQQRLVNRDTARKSCKISNLHATDTVWISPDTSVQPYTGYPIKAGVEFTYNAQGALWCISGSGNTIELALYSETVYEE